MALRGIDRATVIAAQSFTALIPLVLLASGLAPADRPDLVSDALIRKLHLGGSAADAVHEVFAHPAAASTGAFSVVLLVFSGVSLARRLQRLYRMPGSSRRAGESEVRSTPRSRWPSCCSSSAC
jgi:membrane protein